MLSAPSPLASLTLASPSSPRAAQPPIAQPAEPDSFIQAKEGESDVAKPKLEWTEKAEAEDFDAAVKFLSLLSSDTKAKEVVRSLRDLQLVEHAAKDLLRAAQLPLSAERRVTCGRRPKAHSERQGARACASRSRRSCGRTSASRGRRLSPDLRRLLL